ncbi:MAG: hypothetical protein Q7U45_06335 [Burkholderiaceae bacterium]|nr:hypothetical protein [Burkholderiaceae bacterium]MDZ4163162.1 DUF6671 family protein [Burkholderiales bacterium]
MVDIPNAQDPGVAGAQGGARVALLTQHGKEALLAPLLADSLGWVLAHVTGFDTDTLGTFTREVPRPGSQLEAARAKARKGMELSGCPRGLASEGAFVPDPASGLFPWNIELLVLVDDILGVEVVGIAQGPACNQTGVVADWAAAERLALEAGFPTHWLVVRPNGEDDPRVIKGIASWPALRTAFEAAQAQSDGGLVWLESDLRAMANPSRQALIVQAGHDLVRRWRSLCPVCAAPGFWPVAVVRGLPCAACGTPTRERQGERWACVRCTHTLERALTGAQRADPSRCDRCNP